MIQPLKHYAVRLWATVLFGGPAILALLATIGPELDPVYTLVSAGAVLLAVFFGLGAAFNWLGIRSLDNQLNAAEDWERANGAAEAEASYRRAIAVFGSFLFSPRARRRTSSKLADRLARFYMTSSEQSTASEAFIASYLRLHPANEEIARIWLRQAGTRGWLERKDQELAARIGDALPDSSAIQELLARYCLLEERTDFSALEAYRRLMAAAGENAPVDLVSRIANLFVEQGRADEWALPVYVRALEQAPERQELAAGIAACLKWIGETQINRGWIDAGRHLLQGAEASAVDRGIGRFRIPELAARPAATDGLRPSSEGLVRRAGRLAATAHESASGALSAAGRLMADGLQWMKKTPAARRALRWAALSVAALAAILLVVNTAGYLMRPEKRPEPKSPAAETAGRFTIQVAAYLKAEQAQRYAEELKRNGLEAYWTESSGDQKKWYQVRISRFEDKAAARAFGDEIKARGLIEDYYIANYTPPQSSP
ncbi:MAG: SPOR domain-containing protein [Desulfobacterales bacterium]|jgi:hypothetical protein